MALLLLVLFLIWLFCDPPGALSRVASTFHLVNFMDACYTPGRKQATVRNNCAYALARLFSGRPGGYSPDPGRARMLEEGFPAATSRGIRTRAEIFVQAERDLEEEMTVRSTARHKTATGTPRALGMGLGGTPRGFGTTPRGTSSTPRNGLMRELYGGDTTTRRGGTSTPRFGSPSIQHFHSPTPPSQRTGMGGESYRSDNSWFSGLVAPSHVAQPDRTQLSSRRGPWGEAASAAAAAANSRRFGNAGGGGTDRSLTLASRPNSRRPNVGSGSRGAPALYSWRNYDTPSALQETSIENSKQMAQAWEQRKRMWNNEEMYMV